MSKLDSGRDKRWGVNLEKHHRNSRLWIGIIILFIGLVAFIKASFNELPDWLFSWPMLLIVIGLFAGIRRGFRGAGWILIMVIGTAFLVDQNFVDLNLRRYVWPLAIIAVGLIFILRSRSRYHYTFFSNDKENTGTGEGITEPEQLKEDFVEATSVFGGVSKTIVSKNFRGGDIVVVFGGSELNFNQADMQEPAVINFTVVFGGAKLIVPPHWIVRTEMSPLFGGIEDKRNYQASSVSQEKILVLKGTVLFGGIEVKSY